MALRILILLMLAVSTSGCMSKVVDFRTPPSFLTEYPENKRQSVHVRINSKNGTVYRTEASKFNYENGPEGVYFSFKGSPIEGPGKAGGYGEYKLGADEVDSMLYLNMAGGEGLVSAVSAVFTPILCVVTLGLTCMDWK